MIRLPSRSLRTIFLIISSVSLASAEVYFETDFESDTVGSEPAGFDDNSFTPEDGTDIRVVDGGSDPATPLTGQSVYILDSTISDNLRLGGDFNGGANVEAVQVSFDFARGPAQAEGERIAFSITHAGLNPTSSSRRPFELRLNEDGSIDMRSGPDAGSLTSDDDIGTFDPAASNSIEILINSDDSESLAYDVDVGSGTIPANSFHIYINDTLAGSFALALDPSDAGVDFAAGGADLGAFAFYQDTNSLGSLIIDDLVFQSIESSAGPPEYAAFDFESDTVGSEPAGFNDNSFTPEDGTDIRVVDGGSDPATPLTGQSVYILDSTISDNLRLGGDFNGGANVEAVHVSFDFARGPAQAEGERIAFSITHAGLNPTSSSRRPFELRLNEDGSIDMRSGPDAGSLTSDDDIGTFDPAASNSIEILINSDDSESLAYDVDVGSGTIPANSFHIYINDALAGAFALALDPSDAAVDFAAGIPDLGRFAFYQDTNSLGSLIIDNLVFKGLEAGDEPVDPEINIYSSLDFESDTVGEKPVVEGAAFTPGSNNSTNGAVVVDADSTPVANPLPGQSLYLYDLGTSSGNSTHFRYPFNGGEDVSELRVDFDFQRGYSVPEGEGDTGMHVGVGRASAGALNNSDFRPFRMLIFNDGSMSFNHIGGTTGIGDYDVENPNHATFLINSHDSQNVDYDLPILGTGTLLPNTVHVFVNEVKKGEFDFHITPDPVNAPQIIFNQENNDLGQIAFFQDTNSEGGVAFDNIVIQRVNPIGSAPDAPTALMVDTLESRRVAISWTDNSSNEVGFLVERRIGAEGAWQNIGEANADATTFEDTDVLPETTYFYRVSATNGLVSDPTNEVEATTLEQITPFIAETDAGDFAVLDSTVQISLVVQGRSPLSYQWYEGESGDTSNPVAGANAALFVSPPLTGNTSFWVRISNTEGSLDSPAYPVEVHEPVVYNVSTESALEDAIEMALPGDEIVVANGEYTDWVIEFQASGIENAPIVLRAETPGEVVFLQESRLEIGGEWLVVDGFAFFGEYSGNDDEIIQFRADTHAFDCRLTNVSVIDYIPSERVKASYVSMYGKRNRVDNCYFSGHNVPGVTLVVWPDGTPNYHRIDHNHFANRIDGGENGWETIRVGTSDISMSSSMTTVEYNLFTRVDGEIEIISNKTHDNIYRYNTFKESRGTLTLRHGDRCLVEGNYFLGGGFSETGGVRVIGRDHIVINNYFEGTTARDGATITVYAGVPDSPLNEYFSADRATIAFNTFYDNTGPDIEIAAGFGDRDRTVLPTDILIANNVFDAGSMTSGDFISGENAADQMYAGNIAFGRDVGGSVSSGFTIADPLLALDAVSGIMRPSESSPVIDSASDLFDDVDIDIDGQDRDDQPDVGADETSESPMIVAGPLTTMDTGPEYLGPQRILHALESRLVNQSLRAMVSPGSGALIGGFAVRSGLPKTMLIRAAGPALLGQDVQNPISDPIVTVFDADMNPIMTNDDWGDDNASAIEMAAQDVGAFAFSNSSLDAAILAEFQPGLYTVHVTSRDDELGEALLEVYDVSGDVSLANQSSRSKREQAGETSIAGFVIGGDAAKTLLIRGVGPGLQPFGLDDASPDARIELFNEGGSSLGSNDDWGDSGLASEIADAAISVGAFALDAGSKDAAMLVTLEPGLYTVHLTGPNDAVGVLLFELYEIIED